MVLKRLDDAVRDGNKIFAVVEGTAMSADGKGAITAPTVTGQAMCLSRAYKSTGLSMDTVSCWGRHQGRCWPN